MIDIAIDEKLLIHYQDHAKVDNTARWIETRESTVRPQSVLLHIEADPSKHQSFEGT